MRININCIDADRGAWCKNKNIKRSLFGLGARCCVEYPPFNKKCEHKEEHPRSDIPPPPQRSHNPTRIK